MNCHKSLERFFRKIREEEEHTWISAEKTIPQLQANEDIDSKLEAEEQAPQNLDMGPNPNKDKRLDFPTRFISEVKPTQLFSEERKAVLEEIYNTYGSLFENTGTSDEFLYLFEGISSLPANYNPPYYWSGIESVMKALLRIFYIRQPRNLNTLILHSSDKTKGISSHDWGKNKNKVAVFDIETNIVNIIKKVTGKDLKRL